MNRKTSSVHGLEGLTVKMADYTHPIKISADLTEIWQADPRINMEIQGAQNSLYNLEEEQSWGACTSWFQNSPQSYSNQDGVVPAYRQTCRPVRQERESRDTRWLLFWLVLTRAATIRWGRIIFSERCWGGGVCTCIRMRLDSHFMPHKELTKNVSKT